MRDSPTISLRLPAHEDVAVPLAELYRAGIIRGFAEDGGSIVVELLHSNEELLKMAMVTEGIPRELILP